jgi:hypothetical protein
MGARVKRHAVILYLADLCSLGQPVANRLSLPE